MKKLLKAPLMVEVSDVFGSLQDWFNSVVSLSFSSVSFSFLLLQLAMSMKLKRSREVKTKRKTISPACPFPTPPFRYGTAAGIRECERCTATVPIINGV